MNLIIDAGNTFVKFAIFDRANLIFQEKLELQDFCEHVKNVFGHFPKVTHAIVANVGALKKKDIDIITVFCSVHQLSYRSRVPYKNCYATPKSLGVDRMALATAAFYLFPNKDSLVIDLGTCITYDMVLGRGDYLGGAISPGLAMRYKALNQQTDRLPLLEMDDFLDFIGNSTESCIHSGVINGVCCEIDGVINQYHQRFADLTVILTGGDAQFLSKRLKNTIFAHSNFLLEGLNYLLEYNKH
jgi:type III pantothenate kinase